MQHWGDVSSTDPEISSAFFRKRRVCIYNPSSLRQGTPAVLLDHFFSRGNLGVGPLVCSTEMQGQASSTRVSNNRATLNSSWHHWGQQTACRHSFSSSTAHLLCWAAAPWWPGKQMCFLIGSWVSLTFLLYRLQTSPSSLQWPHANCCHQEFISFSLFSSPSLNNISPGGTGSHSPVCYISSEEPWRPFILADWDRLEGITVPWLFEQGGLTRGISFAVPVPCSAIRARLQPAQEKITFVVKRYPCSYLTEAEQKLPRPVTPSDASTHKKWRIWEWAWLVNISVFSFFLTFKKISLNKALKEQELPPQMRKYKTRSPSLFLFFSNSFHGFPYNWELAVLWK